MEQPTALERQFVKSSEEKRSHISEVELNLLRKVTKDDEEETEKTNEDGDLVDKISEMQVLEKKKKKKGNLNDLKDRPQFKRKKTKVFFHDNIFSLL